LNAAAPIFRTDDSEEDRYIVKYSPITSINSDGRSPGSFGFKYYKSLYRTKQVMLRYAEAVNRAGYPRLAFAILRNGLDYEKMPGITDSICYDDVAKTQQAVLYLDSTKVTDVNAAEFYIGSDELRRMHTDPNDPTSSYLPYLDFNSTSWSNDGLHEQGCGQSTTLDTLYSYEKLVAQRMEDEAARRSALTQEVRAKANRLRHAALLADDATGDTGDTGETEEPTEPTQEERDAYTVIDPVPAKDADPDEINAVETLIADECALETAFEGSRMFDLIRFARHKNNAGYDGTNWLAWKIARRDLNVAPYENPTDKGNTSLYNLLLQDTNWYLPNPEY